MEEANMKSDKPVCQGKDDNEECWEKVFREHSPCKKMDADCWVSFFTEVVGIAPLEMEDGSMIGMWRATKCEYGDFECMGKALEGDMPCKKEDMVCWVVTFILLPPCKMED